MNDGMPRLPYGEWPAREARVGEIHLQWAILAVKGVDGDHAVLIGTCPRGKYPGAYDCSANAGGYHWSFQGSVIDEQLHGTDEMRVWVRSLGDLRVNPTE